MSLLKIFNSNDLVLKKKSLSLEDIKKYLSQSSSIQNNECFDLRAHNNES